MEKRMKIWLAMAVPVAIIITAAIFALYSAFQGVATHVTLDQLEAEQVVYLYLATSNYSGIPERLASLETQFFITAGKLYAKNEVDYYYYEHLKDINTRWNALCISAHPDIRAEVCDAIASKVFEWSYVEKGVQIRNISIAQIQGEAAHVSANTKTSSISRGTGATREEMLVYVLRRDDGAWKITDIQNTQGASALGSYDADAMRAQRMTSIRLYEKAYNKTRDHVTALNGLLAAKDKVRSDIESINGIVLRSINADFIDNDAHRYILDIHITYEGGKLLGDEYLDFIQQATQIFKKSFTASGAIDTVQITSHRQGSDDIIAVAQMTKEDTTPVDWNTFNAQQLEDFASVDFRGTSKFMYIVSAQDVIKQVQDIGPLIAQSLSSIDALQMPQQ